MMKVKELIELLGRLNPDDDISLAIAVNDSDVDGYLNYICCEHYVVHECGCNEHELIGVDTDLWEKEEYRKIFQKEYNYPDNKFCPRKKK
jgi:hypothetical protein